MNHLAAIAVPALSAAAVAIGVTVLIERFGGRVGGLLGTLPTTIVPAALGILSQAPDTTAFRVAMFTTPVGMLVNALFLWTWRALPPRLPAVAAPLRLGLMVLASLGVWAGCALATQQALEPLRTDPRAAGLAGLAGTALLVLVGVVACRANPPAPRGRRPVGPLTLASRGVVAAGAIGAAVALARVAGPVAAGLAAVFPAIFLTSMVSLWVSQGEAVQGGAVGPMMLGSASVAAFALVAAWSLPALGAVTGAVLAWAAAVGLATLPAWWWLQRRAPRAPRPAG